MELLLDVFTMVAVGLIITMFVVYQVTYADCQEIVDTCKEHDVILSVCHGMRYTPQGQKVKEIIDSGVIGDVINIQLLEPVSRHYLILLQAQYETRTMICQNLVT